MFLEVFNYVSLISIHALLAESDIKNPEAVSKYMIFLSTLSLRRATNMTDEKRLSAD